MLSPTYAVYLPLKTLSMSDMLVLPRMGQKGNPMRKTIPLFLSLSLLLCLAACSIREIPTKEEKTAEEEIIIPTEAPITPSPEPVVPTEEPGDPAAISILTDIYNNYHPGTAGCSLKAAACAAQMLDWYYSAGSPESAAGSAANFAAVNDLSEDAVHANGIPVDFAGKFTEIWRSAMSLAFGNMGILNDAGYAPETAYRWRPEEVQSLFATLGGYMALPQPNTIWLYYGDENAEHLLATLYPIADFSEYSVLAALRTAGHFDGSVELLSFAQEGAQLTLDFNEAFAQRIRSTGTAGEYITMGSLVNTYLSAFNAETVTVTVEGQSWESGHVIYDMPMGPYEE